MKEIKWRGDLSRLDHSKGGIPETGRVNKNREALYIYDRETSNFQEVCCWFDDRLSELKNDKIDCIIISVKERTWTKS